MSFCPQCGEKQADDAVFCGACGSKLTNAAPPVPPSVPPVQQAGGTRPKGKSILKMILYGVGVVVALFVLLIIYFIATDKDVKSETKVTIQTQAPADGQKAPQPAVTPPVQPQTPSPATAAAVAARVVGIEFGGGFDSEKYMVTGQADSFQAVSLNVVHAVVYVEGVTSPITAKGEWVYLGTRESVWTNEVSLPADGAFHYELSKPSKGWPAGEYALKIHINGREVAYKKFIVR